MNNRIFTYEIETSIRKNITIHEYLKQIGYSQGILTHIKRTPYGITLNGVWAYVNQSLTPGDTLVITLTESDSSEQILPVNLGLNIIYEDLDLMVVDKPSDMPIHPSQGNHDNTLANAVAWLYQTRNEPFVFRCINRLDRDTTGLLILAKNKYSGALLSNMIANREITREYLAIVSGETQDHGTITAPIARVDSSTIEREVNPISGDYACTHYKKLNQKNGCSLVSLQLETGRTHQIRVHMKFIGHPLLGDFLYNPDYRFAKRQTLHSHQLTFVHPITKESMTFTSPLPDDMSFIL